MNRRFLVLFPILVLSLTMMSFPATAGEPGGRAMVEAAEMEGHGLPSSQDLSQLPELQPVDDAEVLRAQAPAGYAKMYWKVSSFWCATGGRIYLSVDGKYKGYATKSGTYYVGLISTARTHKFYARDSDFSSKWGPSSHYIYSYWKKFTWIIKC